MWEGGEVIIGFLSAWKEGRKEGREGCLAYIRETENPKVSGYWAKSRLSSVDLPAPEGPETTIRAFPAGAAGGGGNEWGSGRAQRKTCLLQFPCRKAPPTTHTSSPRNERDYVLAGLPIAALVLAEAVRNRALGCGNRPGAGVEVAPRNEWDALGRRSSLQTGSIQAAQGMK